MSNNEQSKMMDEKTITALKGSIEKWKKVADGSGKDEGQYNCPLCAVFFGKIGCEGCPVRTATGHECCNGTPYREWERHHHVDHPIELLWSQTVQSIQCPECKKLAMAELEFLQGLFPTGGQDE